MVSTLTHSEIEIEIVLKHETKRTDAIDQIEDRNPLVSTTYHKINILSYVMSDVFSLHR